MELNTDATVIAPPGGFVCADIPAVFQFDANGRVIQPAQIWSNEELNPQLSPTLLGTYYLVTFYDQNGARLNASPMWWQFPEVAGSTVDISQVIPISTVGGNVIFYPTAIGAVPSGSTNDVQINIGGVLYGDSGFTYDHTTGLVGIAGTLFVGPNDASFTVNPSTEGLDSTQVVNRIGINNQGTASGKNIGFAVLDEENFSGGSIGPYGTVLETLTTNAGTVTINASVFPSCIVGAAIDCTHVGAGNLAGTMNGPTGLLVSSSVFSNATVSNITGMVLDTGTSGTPTIGQITSLWISPGPDPGATVAKSIGIYIAPMVSASSVEWAIYADGAAASSFGGDLRLDKHIAATSILNQSAPSFIMNGTYWDGAASQDASFTITRTVGAGTNPGMQTNFINAGYGGGGSFVFNAAVSVGGNLSGTQVQAATNFLLYGNTPATGGGNINFGALLLAGNYWTGSVSAVDQWTITPTIGAGTNPTSTLVIAHTGTPGVASVSITSPLSVSDAIATASVPTTRLVDAEPSLTFAGSVTITGSVAAVRGNTTVATGTTIAAGFIYGTQGKVSVVGTLSSANFTAGLLGQLDLSTATGLGSGRVSAIWADMGATMSAGAISGEAVLDIALLTNTAPGSMINSVLHVEALATYLLDISNVSYNPFLTTTAPGTAYGRIAINTPAGVKYIGVYNA